MGKPRLDPLGTVHFHCRACGCRFEAEPDLTQDVPDVEYHPFDYSAACPTCGETAEQAAWEKNLLKAHAHATGPRTPEGMARTAENIRNSMTPEHRAVARFNALKHGAYARTASFFPAKPGHYPECGRCDYLETCNKGACQKKAELFLRHHVAFETQDPKLLRDLHAGTQAGVQAMIDMMIQTIVQDGGPRIKEIKWYHDSDGACHVARWVDDTGQVRHIYEIKAHPLVKPLIEYISRNTLTLADMAMTPKAQDAADALEGHLAGQNQARENLLEHQARQTRALEGLRDQIARSHELTKTDPVLLEHDENNG